MRDMENNKHFVPEDMLLLKDAVTFKLFVLWFGTGFLAGTFTSYLLGDSPQTEGLVRGYYLAYVGVLVASIYLYRKYIGIKWHEQLVRKKDLGVITVVTSISFLVFGYVMGFSTISFIRHIIN